MDINGFGEKIRELFKKYRFVILILGIGIVLMVLPSGKSKQQTQTQTPSSQTAYFEDPTKELTEILSQIQGAGRVQLLLTRGSGERTVYQTDEEQEKSGEDQSVRLETVIVNDADRAQQGLIQQILAPEYRGAIVVCQGADNAAVRLAIMEAVADATGLGTDRISVLKMK
jgi:stage III sporulation protein AG